eukprot:gene4806-7413_t
MPVDLAASAKTPPATDDEDERDSFINQSIRRHLSVPRLFASEVRSVFGWTDVGPEEDDDPTSPKLSKPPSDTLTEHQSRVPRLPVPDLHETAKTYLNSLASLLTADEFDLAEEEVNELLKPTIGPVLQKELEARAADPAHASWLENWWDDSYLCSRDSIAINVNYFFAFEDDPVPENMVQVGRAASLLHGALCAYQKIKTEKLEMDFERKNPLCMSQISRVFAATRVPQLNEDKIITYTSTEPTGADKVSETSDFVHMDPQHVVVLCESKFYSFDAVGEDFEPKSIEELERLLAACIAKSEATGPAIPVELCTTMNRDKWADLRQRMILISEVNRATLEAIQSAVIVVVLEPLAPDSDEELSRLLLHGSGVNRWFDKHNLIVCRNGRAGINFEHAVGDGSTTLRFADEIYQHSVEYGRPLELVAQNVGEGAAARKVKLVEHVWLINKEVENILRDAYEDFKAEILGTETSVLGFKQFGGAFIKTVAGMSPDAFVQVAMQLAYYKNFGRNDATYEAASTRTFFHGRTEVVRSATNEVKAFCESCNASALTHRNAGQKHPTQLRLLREAVKAHTDYMKKAKQGNGVDRHLLGLRMIYEENRERFKFPLPSIFKGSGYRKSSHWNLSTSHCGSPSLVSFGFGPVVGDGFGIGYMIKNNCIAFNITSNFHNRSTPSDIMACLLEGALVHLKSIVLSDPERVSRRQTHGMSFSHPTTHTDELLVQWLRSGKRFSRKPAADSVKDSRDTVNAAAGSPQR